MEEKNKLYIPHGLKTKNEIFTGFGKPEMVKTGIFVCIINAGNAIFYMISLNQILALILVFASLCIGIAVFTKDPVVNLSMADQLGNLIAFQRGQKKYRYERKGILKHENET